MRMFVLGQGSGAVFSEFTTFFARGRTFKIKPARIFRILTFLLLGSLSCQSSLVTCERSTSLAVQNRIFSGPKRTTGRATTNKTPKPNPDERPDDEYSLLYAARRNVFDPHAGLDQE